MKGSLRNIRSLKNEKKRESVLKKNDEINLEITALTSQGSGVGRFNSMAVFVLLCRNISTTLVAGNFHADVSVLVKGANVAFRIENFNF